MNRILSVFLSAVLMLGGTLLSACGNIVDSDISDTQNTTAPVINIQDKTKPTSSETDLTAAKETLRAAFLEKANTVKVTDDSVTFTDASGNGEITVKKNPASVVNLYASFTTLWYEAGGEVIGCIGGSSSTGLYTEYIGRDITQDDGMTVVATSSAGKKWDVETIIALKPELIICSTAMSGYSTIESPADAAGIPLIAVEYNDFSDYLKWFKVFCNLTGKTELWDSIAINALNEVVELLVSCPTENNPSVFSMFASADSLQANTSNTVVGGMISAMNASNIVDNWENIAEAERLDINLETVFAADPDIILVQCHAEVDVAKELVKTLYEDNPVWQSLTAVKEGRVYYLEKSLFHNKPNSRFANAYATMAEYLYPEK